MKIQIKNRWDLSVIFECEADSMKLAVELAVSKKVDLSSANLRSANLRSANLSSADLSLEQQIFIRDDIWAVLSCAPSEVEGLRQALIDGNIDGSHYTGKCVCLVGTIANVRGCSYEKLGALKPDSGRASERFFMGINKGDTPETNKISKQALIWIDEWLFNMRNTFGNSK